MRRCCQLLCLLLALLLSNPVAARDRGPLVLAAASLQESLTAAADAWVTLGNDRPILSFAATSALARQIEAGAPADLFLSADEAWMNVIEAKGLIRKNARADFLTNRLVLIAAAGQKGRVTIRPGFPLAKAIGNGRLAMADPASVPAGRYGRAALTSLGVWSSVASRVAAGESVRAALAMVERRQAPYGIVYETDARAARGIHIVGVFPANSHPPIIYPLARLSRSTHREADAFRRFLLSSRGKAIFRHYGFGTK